MGKQMLEITSEVLGQNLVNLTHSGYLQILIWAIIIDVVSGYAKAFKLKKYNSTIGINGLIRHILVLFIMTIIGVYARALNQLPISIGICCFFIANYVLSIIENFDELGIKFPSWVRKFFEKMKDESNS